MSNSTVNHLMNKLVKRYNLCSQASSATPQQLNQQRYSKTFEQQFSTDEVSRLREQMMRLREENSKLKSTIDHKDSELAEKNK